MAKRQPSSPVLRYDRRPWSPGNHAENTNGRAGRCTWDWSGDVCDGHPDWTYTISYLDRTVRDYAVCAAHEPILVREMEQRLAEDAPAVEAHRRQIEATQTPEMLERISARRAARRFDR